jgi:hypothetical protein
MIQGLSAGYGIHINNGFSSSPYIDPNRYDAGRLRMLGNTLEVYSGSSWCPVTNGTTHVELSRDVLEIIEWARKKRAEEELLEKLAAQVPAVADLKSKLDMMIALTKDYNET